jgi:hypothetical protein
MTRRVKKLQVVLGVAVLVQSGCAVMRSQDLRPLRELSAVETAYLEKLTGHLRQQQQNYDGAIRDLTAPDLELSRTLIARKGAEGLVDVRYRELVSRGATTEEAIRLAGQERLALEEQMLHHLAALREERAAEAKTLHDLYAALQRATEAAAANQRQVDAYLKLNWLQRFYTDVNGLDTDGLEQLGGELKMLVERLGILRGRP